MHVSVTHGSAEEYKYPTTDGFYDRTAVERWITTHKKLGQFEEYFYFVAIIDGIKLYKLRLK